MNTRLKGILTTTAATAALLVAPSAAAAKEDSHGEIRRCEAAVNGNHYGFTCGPCPSRYTVVEAAFEANEDLNGNGVICWRVVRESVRRRDDRA